MSPNLLSITLEKATLPLQIISTQAHFFSKIYLKKEHMEVEQFVLTGNFSKEILVEPGETIERGDMKFMYHGALITVWWRTQMTKKKKVKRRVEMVPDKKLIVLRSLDLSTQGLYVNILTNPVHDESRCTTQTIGNGRLYSNDN